MSTLLPEWHPQWGVMIAWPHADTDWVDLLETAEFTYRALARAILEVENLLVVCRDPAHAEKIRAELAITGAELARLHFACAPYNDTWARDFGPLTVLRDGKPVLLDFTFNGWGNKFDASDDNQVTARLQWQAPVETVDLVLEGGSVEINSNGLLLTTSHCLLNPNRNPHMTQAQIEAVLRERFSVREFLWLHHGHLEGDDTDAHIDTLARFCDDSTIAYVQCTDETDDHYDALRNMEAELQALAAQHQLTLVPLPMADAVFDEDGHRLPGTYANFLIINGAVLVPTYNSARDHGALAQVQKAFPGKRIVGVPCLPLIHQHGSLHCVTMQLPEGVL